jgi:hypothetical protein
MATTYVVLLEQGAPEDGLYGVADEIEAANAEQACRKVAGAMSDEQLERGVTLRAVPARNWDGGRHTLKAETQRRIRSA